LKPDDGEILLKQVAYERLHDIAIVGAYILKRSHARLVHTDCHDDDEVDERHQHWQIKCEKRRTVALMCSSSPIFLFYWLGLLQAGFAVLLINPTTTAQTIDSLCGETRTTVIYYQPQYHDKILKVKAMDKTERSLRHFEMIHEDGDQLVWELHAQGTSITFNGEKIADAKTLGKASFLHVPKPLEAAYYHHSSGTSNRTPDVIPQQYRIAGLHPSFVGGPMAAVYSTTPLYKSGIADCLRAWTSGSMIWLHMEGVAVSPISVRDDFACAEKAQEHFNCPPIKYFSAVPSVIKQLYLHEDALGLRDGLEILMRMEIVGVDGAALSQDIGDDLVKRGVKLVSRYGSVECGFLLSSYRNFEEDKAWDYFRVPSGYKRLSLEARCDGLTELVALHTWPQRMRTNREDGSYATSDLFKPHSSIADAYKIHSRACSQLTLSTGKKFDPIPVEEAILNGQELLSDVLIFGDGEQCAGALLFCSSKCGEKTDEQIIDILWPHIEAINATNPSHSRVAKVMLAIVPEGSAGVKKNGKGITLRKQTVDLYHALIQETYKKMEKDEESFIGSDCEPWIEDTDVPEYLIDLVCKTVSSGQGFVKLKRESNLFTHGVDSIISIQLRSAIQKVGQRERYADLRFTDTLCSQRLLRPGTPKLNPDVIYDTNNVEK
jgi:acyl-CoA synthetase (AMP-forming)/AMP-acid ligase II/aryl carrier-like protein